MRKAAFFLAASLVAGMVLGADGPKDTPAGKPIAAAGVLTDDKHQQGFVMLWPDGEDAPVKCVLGEGFDMNTFGFPPPVDKKKGVFVPDRVKYTCVKGDDGAIKILTMDLAYKPGQPAGKVTGEVLFSNDFWVAVKPRNGPIDGYAMGRPKGWEAIAEKLKTLQKGDWVTIEFNTDLERHRILTLATATKPPPSPDKPAPVAVRPPTSRPDVATTTQPSVGDPAGDKLKLVQMYIDSGMKDKAKEMLQDIIRQYPNTDAAKQAQAKLKELGG